MKKILTLITLAIAINAMLSSCSDGDSPTSAITPSYITKSDKIRIDIPFKKASDTLIQFSTTVFDVWTQFPELSPYKSVRNKITDFVVDSITVQVSGISGEASTAVYGYFTVSSDVGNTYVIAWNTNYYSSLLTPYSLSAPLISDLSSQISLYNLGKKLSSKQDASFEIAIGPDPTLNNYKGILSCRSQFGSVEFDPNCVKSFYTYFAADMLKINKATFGSYLRIGKSTLSSGTLSIRVYYHGKFPIM